MNLPGTPITADDQRKILDPRWIDPLTAASAHLRRVDSPTGGQLVGRNGVANYEGIAIPYFLPGESRHREWRLRRDHPDMEYRDDRLKESGKYMSPPGRGNMLYFISGASPELLATVDLPVIVVEGEFKALALWRLANHEVDAPRFVPIGSSGVWNWRGTVGKTTGPDGDRRSIKGPIPDLDRIAWKDRLVIIACDADFKQNEQVRIARASLAKELRRRGAKVSFLEWGITTGKGIDDHLAAVGPDVVLKEIAAVKPRWAKGKSATAAEPVADGPRPLTELGNAERLVKNYGASFRFCGPRGKSLIFDGTRWIDDEAGQMERWAKTTVREIYREAAACEDSDLRTATAEWAKRSEKGAQIAAMLRLAQSEAGVPIMPSDFDVDPWLFNCKNGTLDLRTGKLHPHRSQDLITKLAPVEYDPAAQCPHFLRFLCEVFEPHPDVIDFIQAYAGYSLTADTREECLAILYGSKGRNGKGTLIKVFSTMLGDYAGTADFSTFIAVRDDRGPRDDIANMRGRRFISAQEGRDGAALAESIIKWLTGGDRVRARKLNENSYEFDPTWKIWLASNYKPVVKGTDGAIWSRIRLIPFDVSFEGREDKTLKTTLMDELPGVLNWALEGCLRWQAEGLPIPESVAAATGEYRAESDQVGRFLADCCVIDERLSKLGRQLYVAYKNWVQDTGEPDKDVMTNTAFGKRLGERFKSRHTERGELYSGVALKGESQ